MPAVLVEIIVFCTVSIIPLAIYSALAAVSGAWVKTFVDELVNLKILWPVLHLGFEFTLGSGIAKVPVTAPLESVTRLPPKEPPSGVT